MADSNTVEIVSVAVSGAIALSSLAFTWWAERRRSQLERAGQDLTQAREVVDQAAVALMRLRHALDQMRENTTEGQAIAATWIVPLRDRLIAAQGLTAVLRIRFGPAHPVADGYHTALQALAPAADRYSTQSVMRTLNSDTILDAKAVKELTTLNVDAYERAANEFFETAQAHVGLRTVP